LLLNTNPEQQVPLVRRTTRKINTVQDTDGPGGRAVIRTLRLFVVLLLALVSSLQVFARAGARASAVNPHSVELIDADFRSPSPGAIEASFDPPINGVVRVVVLLHSAGSQSFPSFKNEAETRNLRDAFTFDVTQYGRPIPVRLEKSTNLRGSLSRVTGEIDVNDLTPGVPLVVHFHSDAAASLQANAYAVVY
jgi:hypothetical protein